MNGYHEVVQATAKKILTFLRTMEETQDNINFARLAESQTKIETASAASLDIALAEIRALAPPDEAVEFHASLTAALTHLENARDAFTNALPGSDIGAAFVQSRFSQCRALEVLYNHRADLPALETYWFLPNTDRTTLGTSISSDDPLPAVGMMNRPRKQGHEDYSLYVPEYYDTDEKWPLIVCLHGGYGRGDDYIWTWLRPAQSRGYLLLSPKSKGVTWSVLQPPVDTKSIRAMVDEVLKEYAVDGNRVYLTGLSDGGTYTYLLGLAESELFAGIAPIAGELSPATDGMLRQKQGLGLPIHVVHGVHDFIFPVESIRSSVGLLEHIGYDVQYTELPDWSHAMTYHINETIVLPWFESLGSK